MTAAEPDREGLRMMIIMSIDTMAQRYGVLPSRLLAEGTTFDFFVGNSALRYQQVKENEANNDYSHLSTEELMAIKEGR